MYFGQPPFVSCLCLFAFQWLSFSRSLTPTRQFSHPIPSFMLWSSVWVTQCTVFQRYIKDPENEDHQQLFDLMEKLLVYEVSSRYSLRQAMRHPFFRKFYEEDFLRRDSGHSSSSERRSHSLSRWRWAGLTSFPLALSACSHIHLARPPPLQGGMKREKRGVFIHHLIMFSGFGLLIFWVIRDLPRLWLPRPFWSCWLLTCTNHGIRKIVLPACEGTVESLTAGGRWAVFFLVFFLIAIVPGK